MHYTSSLHPILRQSVSPKFYLNSLLVLISLLLPGLASCANAKYEPDRVEQEHKFEYAVKFICGKPDFPVVAPGQYFTAINVHNPIDETVSFRKKIAVALPGEKAGPISKFFEARLKHDQALEIDCPDIMKHAEARTEFLKGFVVIQSKFELDVVAVYTTAEWHVESIHTERVAHRIISEPPPVKVPDPEVDVCPIGGLGDQVGQEGCCCNKPKVNPPTSDADWWPDCSPGLVCAGNLPDIQNGIQTNIYSTCTRRIVAGINPPLHWSQPAFCGRR